MAQPGTTHAGHGAFRSDRQLARDGHVERTTWVWQALAAAWVVGAALLVIGLGPSHIMAPTDVLQFLDGGWRILNGQVPSSDYHNPIGPLTYYLVAAGMWLAGPSLTGLVYGNLAFLILAAAWAGIVFFRRLPPFQACVLVVFLSTMIIATRPLGYPAELTSYAMIYNRYGWVLLSILVVQLFLPAWQRDFRLSTFDCVSIGLLLTLLFYSKANFFIVGTAALGLYAIWRPSDFYGTLKIAAIFIAALFVIWICLGLSPFSYAGDVMASAKVQSLEARLSVLKSSIKMNFGWFVLSFVLWVFAILLPVLRDRAQMSAALRATLVYGFLLASALFITVFNATERADIPLLAVAAVILLNSRVPQANAAYGARAPVAGRMAEPSGRAGIVTSAAYVVPLIGMLAPALWIFSNDLLSLVHTVRHHDYRLSRGPVSQRFDSDRLQDFVVPDFSEHKTAYWDAKKLPQMFNDGITLARSHVEPDSRLFILAYIDYFSFALGLTPPRGTWLWWELHYTFDEKHYPAAEAIFADSDTIMIPLLTETDEGCCKDTVEALLRLYRPYMDAKFEETGRSAKWVVYKRRR